MQTLLLADDLWPSLQNGTKRVTVRLGRKDLHRGPLRFQAQGDPARTCQVHVLEVRHTRLCDLTRDDLQGYPVADPEGLAPSLARHYPDIQPESWVTYVRFEGPTQRPPRRNAIQAVLPNEA